ncbi:MAG: divalent-cation tolerance protein CutA [Proteobacteria bacterium]|nr:divalent-cation tolerance protein CutA [Pseudomonadota bacterium]
MPALLVLCTCPDEASALSLAEALVGERLAACVNVLPRSRSVYRWEGRIERAEEVLMLIKTTATRFPALRARIVALHPYTLPEVLALEAMDGLAAYLGWIEAETTPTGDAA